MSGVVDDVRTLLAKHGALTLQNVLEIEECVLKSYLEQREKQIKESCSNDSDESSEEAISVESDSEGDYIDKEGNIYNVNSKQLIGKKDLKTKEKVMYNVL
jgi:hypothetical protein